MRGSQGGFTGLDMRAVDHGSYRFHIRVVEGFLGLCGGDVIGGCGDQGPMQVWRSGCYLQTCAVMVCIAELCRLMYKV